MGNFWTSFVTVLTAITGIALVAVLVSRNANTSGVISSFWGGFSNSLTAAEAPVTNVTGNQFSNPASLVAGQLASFGSTANLA